ncbi:serine hydrolase domain-containing protein [Streptomyces thermolilacinus]|uniref:Peptidase n=1 Tax=Streptomyces thermolilacinus SPC6 TaxID=1306406 RepID=A0A1D3DVC8_9ACTN|nr:serine hydrolase domain-containing protein [Streptomyces thermolilacinus]OEJ96266.1 peptidase [Streptomyces thermolilacinus SPC6]
MSVRTVRAGLVATLAVAAVTATALTAPASAAAVGTTAPASATAGAGRHDATRQVIEQVVRNGAPGVLAQARDRYGVWNGSAGVADRTTGRERLPHDRFRVGSLTKTFVATVILQLEAEGRLDLDDSVEKWLPGVVRGNGHDGRRVTIRQILNHTSGIHNVTADPGFQEKVFGPGFLQHRYDTWTPGQLVAIAMAHEPDFAPGASWNYSNTNYVLAGMIIEKVTGRPYGEAVERRIIKPLGLGATSVPGTDPRMPRPSGRAYSTLGGAPDDPATRVHDVTELNPSIAWAAGEMISSTADLQRFTRALMTGRLLPGAQMRELTTTVTGPEDPSAAYGLGVMKRRLSCGTEVWGHTGGIHGSGSVAVTTRRGDHTLAANVNGDWAGGLDKILDAEFCGKKPDRAAPAPVAPMAP